MTYTLGILLLQQSDVDIKDKKGNKNLVAYHLSRLTKSEVKHQVQINDTFLDEQVLVVSHFDEAPWFSDIVNYLATKVIPLELSSQRRNKFFSEVEHYYKEDPLLNKHYANQIVRSCVPNEEMKTF